MKKYKVLSRFVLFRKVNWLLYFKTNFLPCVQHCVTHSKSVNDWFICDTGFKYCGSLIATNYILEEKKVRRTVC